MDTSTLDTLLDGSFFGTAVDCMKAFDKPRLLPNSASSAVPPSCCSSFLCSSSSACCRTPNGNNDNTGSRGQKRHRHNHHHLQHHHQQKQQQQQQHLDADTIVIGNGPAGIALSALLSGWRPFYNKRVPHPDPHLHAQLMRMASGGDDNDDNCDLSLLDHKKDLDALADQHFERAQSAGGSAGGHTPFSVLYDCLARPHLSAAFASSASHATTAAGHHAAADGGDADAEQFVVDGTSADGEDCGQRHRSPSPSASPPSPSSSCLCWRRREHDAISHIVLGDQQIGGSWTEYDDHMLTVSAAEWMDLPGFSLAADFVGDAQLAQQRPRAGLYKAYLNAYVDAMGLRHNFKLFTRVTHIEKICHPSFVGPCHWLLHGTETVPKTAEQRTFTLRCRHVVLACGRQQPKLLGVPGETAAAADGRLVYSLSSLKQRLEETERDYSSATETAATMVAPATATAAMPRAATSAPTAETEEVSGDCPVVVVGDGISAADAVLHCLSIEQPVLHIVRRTERELRNIQLSRLSSTVYPEYARVYRLMTGRTREVNYRRLLGTSVHSIVAATGAAGGADTAPTGGAGGVLRLLASNDKQQQHDHHDGQQHLLLREQRFRALAICIGRRLELPLLKAYLQHNSSGSDGDDDDDEDLSTEFTTSYQSASDPTLFAIGAMAGDHFVRFLVGGTLCVAQTLHRLRKKAEKLCRLLAAATLFRASFLKALDCAFRVKEPPPPPPNEGGRGDAVVVFDDSESAESDSDTDDGYDDGIAPPQHCAAAIVADPSAAS
ncbi:hypothetical protein niasHT_001890 [Heterodera trifolii]|uniref:Uncharacterized protein n=1 Tax=Heterodera trifolii TaxID=157864 RepID=A0ABD2LS97_9BILA